MRRRWNVARKKVFISAGCGAKRGILWYHRLLVLLWARKCKAAPKNPASHLLPLVESLICCTVLKKVFVSLWDPPGCVLLAREGKWEKLEPVCTCTEVTSGLLTVCQCRGQSLPEEGLGYRQTSKPARQAASHIVYSLGLGLEPGLGQLKLPRQIC